MNKASLDLMIVKRKRRMADRFLAELCDRFDSSLPEEDKRLLLYYAFIMICDSTAAKFPQFGNSAQVQMFFLQEAIKELRKQELLPE